MPQAIFSRTGRRAERLDGGWSMWGNLSRVNREALNVKTMRTNEGYPATNRKELSTLS
jgi:hypothetical protein